MRKVTNGQKIKSPQELPHKNDRGVDLILPCTHSLKNMSRTFPHVHIGRINAFIRQYHEYNGDIAITWPQQERSHARETGNDLWKLTFTPRLRQVKISIFDSDQGGSHLQKEEESDCETLEKWLEWTYQTGGCYNSKYRKN